MAASSPSNDTTNLPMASTISLAMKMAASARRGCQTVCLLAESSAAAPVSRQRETASIFPLESNEISITTSRSVNISIHSQDVELVQFGNMTAEILYQYVQYEEPGYM